MHEYARARLSSTSLLHPTLQSLSNNPHKPSQAIMSQPSPNLCITQPLHHPTSASPNLCITQHHASIYPTVHYTERNHRMGQSTYRPVGHPQHVHSAPFLAPLSLHLGNEMFSTYLPRLLRPQLWIYDHPFIQTALIRSAWNIAPRTA
ncbi:hypothetical protein GQ43DRAFT_299875 [Delitschia confertaspora ATCC 74209]|uniref:Uncharacterized protein n=1 Tax=Delitschia confertaspora ATCC 74209 TaxID=1513339 RepID=A0A9P4JUI3_9PLEO|nr:hypothetical protein GQ43DRAFT_299875 [Delitschia confertaspora ATCC 74209]